MSTGLHKDLELVEIHRPHAWEYANASARTGASGFVAADVGKLARQLDDNSLWMLTATTPTWVAVGGGGAPAAHATTHEPGGSDTMAVDAAGATGSLRTLGTSSTSACAGNDSRLSDARTPTAHASTHNAGGGDAMAIDAVAGTGSLRTLGTSSTAACAGNDSRLSDARTPTVHATSHKDGGTDHIHIDEFAAASDNTNLNATTSAHGLLPKLGGGTTNYLRADGTWAAPPGGGTAIVPHKMFQADQLESPNSSNWAVNSLATLEASPTNPALLVRAFDDTAAEGVGFTVRVPTGATNIILGFLSRARTAPGSAKTVGLNLYRRAVPDNAVIPSWSSATALTAIDIPTNDYYQKDSQTIALSTLGMTVGVTYTLELTRNLTGSLVGDWLLHSLTVGWS